MTERTKKDLLKAIMEDSDLAEALVNGSVNINYPRSKRDTVIWNKAAQDFRMDEDPVTHMRWLVKQVQKIRRFSSIVEALALKEFPESDYRFTNEYLGHWRKETEDFFLSKINVLLNAIFDYLKFWQKVNAGKVRVVPGGLISVEVEGE